jgi:hypothetical protein
MTVFETETMAELCVKQGLVSEGLAIYRRLVEGAADAATRARRAARLAELERVAAGAARRRADVAADRAPPPPGAALTLERREDALTFTWTLPSETATPALQLLLVVKGSDGVEAEMRTLPLDRPAGTLTLRVAGLHSLRAALGRLDEGRFFPIAPIARLPSGEP